MESNFTCFVCTHCNTEIEASIDMIGQSTECPACGTKLMIPDNRQDGVKRHSAGEDDPDKLQAMKSRTIRIDLGDL